MFRVKDRQIALNLFGLATVALLPLMLVFNFWGNFLIEQIETNKKCVYKDVTQSFELLYLVATYCTIFMYITFCMVIRETMKRYYVAIEINPASLRS